MITTTTIGMKMNNYFTQEFYDLALTLIILLALVSALCFWLAGNVELRNERQHQRESLKRYPVDPTNLLQVYALHDDDLAEVLRVSKMK
jgi:hypothetical protein